MRKRRRIGAKRQPPPNRRQAGPHGGPLESHPIGTAAASVCGRAGVLNCFSTFALSHFGQVVSSAGPKTSALKGWSHSRQTYSYNGIFSPPICRSGAPAAQDLAGAPQHVQVVRRQVVPADPRDLFQHRVHLGLDAVLLRVRRHRRRHGRDGLAPARRLLAVDANRGPVARLRQY